MAAIVLLTADAPGIGSAFGAPQWGIFNQGGGTILGVDSVESVEYVRDYHISDYPQEKGAFESYNKVRVPFKAKVGFFIGLSRLGFLNAVEAAVASLDLVTVVTPEKTYPSANLTHYSYRREARSGVTLIRVDVWCEEVRIVSGTAFSNAQSTNAVATTQSGEVQATPTKQNAPVATETDVGGNFTTNFGEVNDNVDPDRTDSLSKVRNTALTDDEGAFVNDPATTIPAGIPNSTGGGASSLDVPLGDFTITSKTPGF